LYNFVEISSLSRFLPPMFVVVFALLFLAFDWLGAAIEDPNAALGI